MISNPQDVTTQAEPRGARARTRKLMLNTAIELMQRGQTPSVSDVADAAEVSRATAYRYFPSQAALVDAVITHSLEPILEWRSDSDDAETRVLELLSLTMPRIDEFEASFKAALKLSLELWAERRAGTFSEEPPFKRGHRVVVLQRAIDPLRHRLPEADFKRLAKALSLVYGLEVLVVLKDIWGLDLEESTQVAAWAASTLIRAALAEAGAKSASR